MSNFVVKWNNLQVHLGIWGGLIMLVTIAVALLSNSGFAVVSVFTTSLAASVIGFVSVFFIVIMISPNHSTSSSIIPNSVVDFQEKMKVSTKFDSINIST